ncbi:MAG: four helix bundle protein [Gammaproteobacteria bacterium]
MDAFEDLEVWKRSSKLAVDIYATLKTCKDYGLKDQIVRAAVSISSNIAEGFERNSNKQFVQFLQIAKGSCGEFRSQLYICAEIGEINIDKTKQLQQDTIEISRMLQGLINHCRRNEIN